VDIGKRKTLNPYFVAGRMGLLRLQWDLQPRSWISRRRVRRWKNRYKGGKAIILCNGPSLNHVDFDLLQESGVFTFGLNKINLLFSRTDFRPSVIVSVNPLVIEQNAAFFNTTELPLFLDGGAAKHIQFRENIHFLHTGSSVLGKFARDCSMSINQGYTVTYVAMQLAFHMGFDRVALVGCDHSFAARGPANQTVVAGKTDPDHFDPHYFSGGMKWQLPDLMYSEFHYRIARDVYEQAGRRIVNCTVGGKLEVFERQDLGDFLDQQLNQP